MDTKLAAKPSGTPLEIAYPKGAEAQCRYLLTVSNMLLCDHSNRVNALWVGRMLEIYSEPEFQGHPCATHDIAILDKVSNPEDAAFLHLPINRCGAYMLPVSPSSVTNGNVPKKPDYLVGLQNLDTLRRLSDGTKNQINAIQKTYRQPIIRWE